MFQRVGAATEKAVVSMSVLTLRSKKLSTLGFLKEVINYLYCYIIWDM